MSVRRIAFSGVIGAVYAVLTIVLAPISFGPVQLRIAEALCILPLFFPASSWGLFIGCILANLMSSYGIFDVIFGSAATLISVLIVRGIGKTGADRLGTKLLACFPPVITNGIIVGGMIAWITAKDAFWPAFILNGAQVAAGEIAVMLCAGLPIALLLPKTGIFRFMCEKYNK